MRYLLGTLSEEEKAGLEDRFFSDDQEFEELEIAEEELVDCYVRGELSPDDRKRFEKTLLSSPRLVERVQFAKVLANKVASSLATASSAQTHKPKSMRVWWRTLFGTSFDQRPAFGMALALALLLLISVGFAIGWLKLRSESQQRAVEQAALQQREHELEKQSAEQQSKNNQLEEELAKERKQRETQDKLIEELRAQKQPAESGSKAGTSIASILLFPGGVRGAGKRSELTVGPETSTIQFKLPLESGEYRSYTATVLTPERTIVFQKASLKPTRNANTILLQLPAKLLPAGDYVIHVDGLTTSGAPESVDDYMFRLVKR
jgi:hypothetical protein